MLYVLVHAWVKPTPFRKANTSSYPSRVSNIQLGSQTWVCLAIDDGVQINVILQVVLDAFISLELALDHIFD